MKQQEKKLSDALANLLSNPEKLKQEGVFEQAVLQALVEMSKKLNKLYELNTSPLIK